MEIWIKGGILGFLFGIIVFLLDFIYFIFCYTDFGDIPLYCTSINFLTYPSQFFFFLDSSLLNFIFYLLIGALIGLIIMKVKSKKGKN